MLKIEFEQGDIRVTTDDWNYIVQEKRVAEKGKTAGQVYWATKSYHTTLSSLSRALVDAFAPKTDIRILKDVNALEKALEKSITKLEKLLAKGAK